MGIAFIGAVASLVLIAIPVFAPRAGVAGALLWLALAAFFLVKAYASAHAAPPGPDDPLPRFNWGLDRPLGIALALYALLWIGIAGYSIVVDRRRV